MTVTGRRRVGDEIYLPAARRWKRVRLSIFLCFFLRMRLRRFLISEPMRSDTLPGAPVPLRTRSVRANRHQPQPGAPGDRRHSDADS